MILAVDSHVHIYPSYSIDEALDAVLENALKLGLKNPEISFILCLTERFDCSFFDSAGLPAQTRLSSNLIKFSYKNITFYILRGYQVISTEGVEVLGLGLSDRIPDRTFPAMRLATKIKESGAIAVFPWGLGKWLGKRMTVISKVLNSDFGIRMGTTALQPSYARTALKTKFKNNTLWYGSDALPLRKEAALIGSMLTVYDSVSWDESETQLKEILNNSPFRLIGKKTSPFETAYRELRRRFNS